MTDLITLASSVILLLILIQQAYKQWKAGTADGISKLLFFGQVHALIGFTIYSYMVGNGVLTISHAILTMNNFIGLD